MSTLKPFKPIDAATLRLPDFVEQISYDEIKTAMLDDLRSKSPSYADLALESDPAVKLLEVAAFREQSLRQRINDAVKAVLVAFSKGGDLDNLAALVPVSRMVNEGDDSLRERVQMAPEAFTVAGSPGAYIFHARSADTAVLDVSVTQKQPGYVTVLILSREDSSGVPSAQLLDTVEQVYTEDTVPLTDVVDVVGPTFVDFNVTADLWLGEGPDTQTVLSDVRNALLRYGQDSFRFGRDITIVSLMTALNQGGVLRATLKAPLTDLVVDASSVPRMGEIVLNVVKDS